MRAYGYNEGDGAKGGNNVASLLMQALRNLGWLIADTCGGRLSIIMDNCDRQNENNRKQPSPQRNQRRTTTRTKTSTASNQTKKGTQAIQY